MAERRSGFVPALASGAVFALATPPTDLALGIPAGLVLFALALRDRRRGATAGFGFGLAANLLALRFVPEVVPRFTGLPSALGWLALLLLAAAQALPWALGSAACIALARRRVPYPLAFATGTYVAAFVPALFPWTPAGGLATWPVFLQTAELVGERGTSFLLALGAAFLAEGLRPAHVRRRGRRRRGPPLAAAATVGAVLAAYGLVRMRAVDAARAAAPHARVALVQPDFDAMFRWQASQATTMMDRLTAATRDAEARGAVLTVWPESAYPYTLPHGLRVAPFGERAVLRSEVHGPVLTGAYLSKGDGLGTNAAILVHDGAVIDPAYDKRHLLWFGETVPLGGTFPVLRKIFAKGTGLEAGRESVLFRTGPIGLTVLNCYEDTLPEAGREAMDPAPNLLVNVTNDAWFEGSAEGELHLRLAAMRAIETRRDLLRAVNRGPTSWVDAAGRIRARHREPGPLLVDAALLEEASAPRTPWVVVGDGGACLLAAAAVLLARRRRPK